MTSDNTKGQNQSTENSKKEILQNPILRKSHSHQKSEKAKRKEMKDKMKKGEYDE